MRCESVQRITQMFTLGIHLTYQSVDQFYKKLKRILNSSYLNTKHQTDIILFKKEGNKYCLFLKVKFVFLVGYPLKCVLCCQKPVYWVRLPITVLY